MQFVRYFFVVAAFYAAAPALAQNAPPAASSLMVELNAADTIGESCRLTFVLNNTLASDIEKFVSETVLFSDEGQVVLLTLFDFGTLPKGRARVRQFQVPETSCDRLGLILFNGADRCDGQGHSASKCAAALSLSSRVRIGLEG